MESLETDQHQLEIHAVLLEIVMECLEEVLHALATLQQEATLTDLQDLVLWADLVPAQGHQERDRQAVAVGLVQQDLLVAAGHLAVHDQVDQGLVDVEDSFNI